MTDYDEVYCYAWFARLLPTSSEKMEATLQSISEELARCRQLLLSQRPQEVIIYSSVM